MSYSSKYSDVLHIINAPPEPHLIEATIPQVHHLYPLECGTSSDGFGLAAVLRTQLILIQFFIVLTDFLVYIYNFIPRYTKLLDVNTEMTDSKKKLN